MKSTDPERAAAHRRLEAEFLMFQSDHAKLLRKKEQLDTDKRALRHAIEAKEVELAAKEEEERRLITDLQTMENELKRLKHQMNAL